MSVDEIARSWRGKTCAILKSRACALVLNSLQNYRIKQSSRSNGLGVIYKHPVGKGGRELERPGDATRSRSGKHASNQLRINSMKQSQLHSRSNKGADISDGVRVVKFGNEAAGRRSHKRSQFRNKRQTATHRVPSARRICKVVTGWVLSTASLNDGFTTGAGAGVAPESDMTLQTKKSLQTSKLAERLRRTRPACAPRPQRVSTPLAAPCSLPPIFASL